LAPLAWADDSGRFDIDDLLALRDLSQIDVSPEGDYVAYTVTHNDLEDDTQRSVVWMVPASGGEPLRMTAEDSDASRPGFSPDGRYLAVVSDRKDDKGQVWLLDRRGGDAQQLTKFPQGVDAFEWSPDGKRMLLLVADPSPADLDKKERPHPRPWVIDRLQFKQDYVGYLDRHRVHIHILDVATGETRQLTSGDYDDSDPAWSPDGKRIVFVSNRSAEPDRNRNTDLWLVDADAGNAEPSRLTQNETADASPSWSPDGRSLVYTSTDSGVLPIYALPRLTVMDIKSRESRVFESLNELQVFGPRFSRGGESLITIVESRGEQFLARVDADSGNVQRLIDGENVVSEFSESEDGRLYALVSRPARPGEVFALRAGKLDRITDTNDSVLADTDLAAIEKFAYRSSDGTAIEGFVAWPPGYKKGRKAAGLLKIHGGPQSQFDYGFSAETQLMAAQGYVVIMPNPRGSTGYGQAFAAAIYQDWGGIDYQDVIAAMDHAVAEGWVDPGRMGVFGWSYGGMMTNHVITRTDRFKAAVTGASATLYMANYGHDQYQRWWEEELGLPWLEENREKWNRISPFFRLDQVKTPTLVVGGEQDWNVPIINSEQLYIALKRQGVPTELVVYPDQGHIFSVPSYNRDLYERYVRWFERWITKS